jgi:hypothetical protein
MHNIRKNAPSTLLWGVLSLGLVVVSCSPSPTESPGPGPSVGRGGAGGGSGGSPGQGGSGAGSGGSAGGGTTGTGGSTSGTGGAGTGGGSEATGGTASSGSGGTSAGSGGSSGGSGGGGEASGGASGSDGPAPASDAGPSTGSHALTPDNALVQCKAPMKYRLPDASAGDFCAFYEKYCHYDPTGMEQNKGKPPGAGEEPWFYKSYDDCMMRYTAASAGAKSCRAGQLCGTDFKNGQGCTHASGHFDTCK